MTSTSASRQIPSAIQATLNGFDLLQISIEATILPVKTFTVELWQMAAAVKTEKLDRKFGNMHLILNEKEYHVGLLWQIQKYPN